jgi:hypothetical protein
MPWPDIQLDKDSYFSDLSHANLRKATLKETDLGSTNLEETDLILAKLGGTRLTSIDLSEIKGLEKVNHRRGSSLGTNSLKLSKGRIPRSRIYHSLKIRNDRPFTPEVANAPHDASDHLLVYLDYIAIGINQELRVISPEGWSVSVFPTVFNSTATVLLDLLKSN